MKKIVSIIVLAFAVSACGGASTTGTTDSTAVSTDSTAVVDTTAVKEGGVSAPEVK